MFHHAGDEGIALRAVGVVFGQALEQVQDHFLLQVLAVGVGQTNTSDQLFCLEFDDLNGILVNSFTVIDTTHLSLLGAEEELVRVSTCAGMNALQKKSGGIASTPVSATPTTTSALRPVCCLMLNRILLPGLNQTRTSSATVMRTGNPLSIMSSWIERNRSLSKTSNSSTTFFFREKPSLPRDSFGPLSLPNRKSRSTVGGGSKTGSPSWTDSPSIRP